VKKIQIEQDLLAKFLEYPLDSIDRFMLQRSRPIWPNGCRRIAWSRR